MYSVSDKFKQYSALRDRIVQAQVDINGAIYGIDSIVEFVIEDSIVTEEDFELGSVVSSTLSLTIKTDDFIANNAEIKPYIRFVSEGDPTEWLPLGVFYVDSRKKQNGVWKFSAFDRLILSQALYETDLQFPTTMEQVLTEVCSHLGIVTEPTVVVDPTLMINTKPEYGTYTYRDIIRFIATTCGKCARMSKNGKLDFVDVSNRVAIESIPASDITRCEETNPLKTITKLIVNYDSELEPYIVGDGDVANTLWVYNPYVTQEIADSMFLAVANLEYMPLSFSWKCRPHLEVGDLVSVDYRGTIYTTIILRNTIKFKGGLTAETHAPSSTAQESEFGFSGTIDTAISKVGSRIGLFAQAINQSTATIRTTSTTFLYIPITTSAETDVEFIIAIMGTATVDGILTLEIKLDGSPIGIPWRYPVKTGANLVSLSFLIRKIPKVSGILLLTLKMSSGTFTIAKNEGQFNLYGGNLVMDTGIPYLVFEEIVGGVSGIEESVVLVELQTPLFAVVEDEPDTTVPGISDVFVGGVLE